MSINPKYISHLLCRMHACLITSARTQNMAPYPTDPATHKKHTYTDIYTHKRKCGDSVEDYNENFNLRKEQPASAWGWVNSGLLYFMPPHHWGPLDALSPFRTTTTPSKAQRCLRASPIPSHPLCEEDLNPWKPQECTMDSPLPPMIQLWRERNMGEEGDEREGAGGEEDGGRASI